MAICMCDVSDLLMLHMHVTSDLLLRFIILFSLILDVENNYFVLRWSEAIMRALFHSTNVVVPTPYCF